MSDIRLITIDESGVVNITADYMHIPLNDRDAAYQRVVIALMTTIGSMVDAPGWGGSLKKLVFSTRRINISETKNDVAAIIQSAASSLLESEPDGDYRVIDLTLKDVSRLDRGLAIRLNIVFNNASSSLITIPGVPDVVV